MVPATKILLHFFRSEVSNFDILLMYARGGASLL